LLLAKQPVSWFLIRPIYRILILNWFLILLIRILPLTIPTTGVYKAVQRVLRIIEQIPCPGVTASQKQDKVYQLFKQ
jgi:hypothetical protein